MSTFPFNYWYRGAPIGDARTGASTDFGRAYRGNVGVVVGKSLAATVSIASADAFAFTDGLQPRSSGGGAAAITVDTFTGAAGTVLASHAPDAGGSWTNHPSYASQGTGKITGAFRARFGAVTSGSSAALYWSGAPTSADYAVSADVYIASAGGQAGVAARVDVASNTMVLAYYAASSGVLTLGQLVSGALTSLATTTLSWAVGSTHALSLAVSGSSATASVGGSVVLGPVTVTPAAAGRIGIYLSDNPASASDSTSTHLDNFGFNGSLGSPTQSGVTPESVSPSAFEGFSASDAFGAILAASRSIDVASAWDSSSSSATVSSRDSWASFDAGSILVSGPTLIVSGEAFGLTDHRGSISGTTSTSDAWLEGESVVLASAFTAKDATTTGDAGSLVGVLVGSADPWSTTDRSTPVSASLGSGDVASTSDAWMVAAGFFAVDVFASNNQGTASPSLLPLSMIDVDRIAFVEASAVVVRASDSDPLVMTDGSGLAAGIGSADVLAMVEVAFFSLAPLGIVSLDSAGFVDRHMLSGSPSDSEVWAFPELTTVVIGVASLDAFGVVEAGFSLYAVSSRDAFAAFEASFATVYTATLNYHVYANDGAGGPINYASAVATTSGLSWTSGPLAAGGDYWWGVRAYSLATSLEEQNLDAAVEVVLDGTWADVTNRPAPPTSLRASPLAGGVVRVEWSDRRPAGVSRATGYRVYQGVGSVDWTTPVADVPASAGIAGSYSTKLGPLADGVVYLFGVRAYNATASEANTASVSATADATGPAAVDGFAVTLTSES